MTRTLTRVWLAAALAAAFTRPAAHRAAAAEPKAAEKASPRAQAVEFLRQHVVGKTLAHPPGSLKLDGGKVELVTEAQLSFSNLIETSQGFRFDLTVVASGTSYEIGPDGKRSPPTYRWNNNVSVMRYEMKELLSTKALIGFARKLSSTGEDDPTGFATAVQVVPRDGQLIFQESGVLYTDLGAAKGAIKPGTFEGPSRLSLRGGKLQFEEDRTLFDVDPATLKRTPIQDSRTVMTYNEVEPGK